MSELILHAAHLSEAHQLRFSYLFDVAAKNWQDARQETEGATPPTELWVIDAQSAPEAISERPENACVLLIATDVQADALRSKWPHHIDAQLPPDYSVGRLSQILEQISLQAHGKRLRETLRNRRQQSLTGAHNIQIKTADASFLKATDVDSASAAVTATATAPSMVSAADTATTTTTITPAATIITDAAPVATAETESMPAPGTRFRIKRWTQLTGSFSAQSYKQILAAMISADRTLEELSDRSSLDSTEILRLFQVLRGKGLLIEIEPAVVEAPEAVQQLIADLAVDAPALQHTTLTTPAPEKPAAAPKGMGLFRQLSRWIGQNRSAA